MKRPCDSCRKRSATRRVVLRGVTFHVCAGCAPATAAVKR